MIHYLHLVLVSEEQNREEDRERDTYFVNKDKDRFLPYPASPHPRPPQHEHYREVKIAKSYQPDRKRILPLPRKIDIKNEYKL